jgi:hypothetical protein
MTEQQLSPRYGGVDGRAPAGNSLADVLERVLDKGVVIVGDIQVRLLDIELLTIKVRLMIASVERAQEMGIDWWKSDPFVSSLAPAERKELSGSRERREDSSDG